MTYGPTLNFHVSSFSHLYRVSFPIHGSQSTSPAIRVLTLEAPPDDNKDLNAGRLEAKNLADKSEYL